MDFSELLGLEEGQTLVLKKDGEEVKHDDAPKPEAGKGDKKDGEVISCW